MRHYCFFAIFASSLFGHTVKSQVTIGAGIAPSRGALLELKSQEPDDSNVTSTLGGLLLSRVALTDLRTLEPFIRPSDTDYEEQKRTHTGLFVYNVTTSDILDPGLYLWDGDQWNIVNISRNPKEYGNGNEKPNESEIPGINDALSLPNSYIIKPGTSIYIPIVKAYSVWKKKLDTDLNIEQHEITAELLWQDEQGLVKEVSLNKGSSNLKTSISIVTNKEEEGNAVVVVKMNGIVRWSWHLWITDFNTSEKLNQNITDKAVFMNRYLGATNCSPGDIGSIGLLYQWGRKDPFSGSASTTTEKEKVHYTIDNAIISKPLSKERVKEKVNLSYSIMNPTVYYTDQSDWYTNNGEFSNDLWLNTDNSKGFYDPCPEGWRVPISEEGNLSVWQGLEGAGRPFDNGTGVEWKNYGYYQASGIRNTLGELEMVGKEAYVWSAKNFYKQAYRLRMYNYNVYPQHASEKSKAHSVRCVTDRK